MNAPADHATRSQPAALADQPIGQIAVNLPGATAVCRRAKLDFCCGGQISLRQAVTDKGLDLGALQAELAALDRSDDTPPAASAPELIDHILSRYHEVHRQQLPELIRMAQRVESVHRANPNVPAGLASLLEAVQQDLLSHMHKEEAILFPMLKSGGNPFVNQPISVMRAEHVDHIATLEKLASMTNDATPPEGACNTWRALYAGIGQLHDDLINHIHLENNVLFPRFEPRPANEAGCGTGATCGCAH